MGNGASINQEQVVEDVIIKDVKKLCSDISKDYHKSFNNYATIYIDYVKKYVSDMPCEENEKKTVFKRLENNVADAWMHTCHNIPN